MNYQDNVNFWNEKRVLITGHTGFKGSWLVMLLKKLGANVCGISLEPPTDPSLYEITDIDHFVDSHICDIRDDKQIIEIFNKFKPEIVFHMAAQPIVGYSYRHPGETYSVNVMGTLSILEAIRNTPSVRVGIMITTDKCYKNNEWVWGYRETDTLGGYDPYSSSKAATEILINSYRSSYFSGDESQVCLASARAGNVIGGGDWGEDRLIPDIINSVLHNQPITLRNQNAVRPWQHVLDPLNAYLRLAQACYFSKSEFSGAWNFGPDVKDSRNVSWVTERILELWGRNDEIKRCNAESYKETNYLKLDCTKAHEFLDWKPVWEVDYTLKQVVDWYKAYQEGKDMYKVSCVQIENFFSISSNDK
jgi:CDP-glucose 4,6-dehydratase